MKQCPYCGEALRSEARFCRRCGGSVGRSAPPRPTSYDWYTLDQVINSRVSLMGAVGALVAFMSIFCPWENNSIILFGFTVGSSSASSPFSWLIFPIVIAAGILVFKKASGSIVMVLGIVTAGFAVLSAMLSLASQGSPAVGTLLALLGGGLMAFSGYHARQGY